MPKRIEQVFDQPKVREVIIAIGVKPVTLQLEFELIKLAALMSVGGNLNKMQITFIAESLIGEYPNESIADFKICFDRGAMGAYGEIKRLDGATIGLWMKAYLDEKYEILETQMMKEKESIYQPIVNTKPPEGVAPPEVAKEYLSQMLQSVKGMEAKQPAPLTDKDVKLEGAEKPKRIPPKATPIEFLVDREMKSQWMRESFDIITGHKKKDSLSYKEWLNARPGHFEETKIKILKGESFR